MTTSAVVYAFLFIHIGVILVVTAYYTVGAVLAPRITERARVRFARRPWLPAVIGLALSAPWMVAAIALLSAPSAPLKFLGAVLAGLWVLGGLLGGAAVALHLGSGGGDAPSTSAAVRGGLLITLTWVLPLVGWLCMLPLSLATGIGCLVLGLRRLDVAPPPAVAATV